MWEIYNFSKEKKIVWNYPTAYITTSPLWVECGNPKTIGCLYTLTKVKKNMYFSWVFFSYWSIFCTTQFVTSANFIILSYIYRQPEYLPNHFARQLLFITHFWEKGLDFYTGFHQWKYKSCRMLEKLLSPVAKGMVMKVRQKHKP